MPCLLSFEKLEREQLFLQSVLIRGRYSKMDVILVERSLGKVLTLSFAAARVNRIKKLQEILRYICRVK
jgi:hypothetical protein